MKEAQVHAVPLGDADQRRARLVQFPVRGQVAAVLVAVRIAEHHLLHAVAGGEQGAVGGHAQQAVHHLRGGAQVGDRFEQRHQVHAAVGARPKRAARRIPSAAARPRADRSAPGSWKRRSWEWQPCRSGPAVPRWHREWRAPSGFLPCRRQTANAAVARSRVPRPATRSGLVRPARCSPVARRARTIRRPCADAPGHAAACRAKPDGSRRSRSRCAAVAAVRARCAPSRSLRVNPKSRRGPHEKRLHRHRAFPVRGPGARRRGGRGCARWPPGARKCRSARGGRARRRGAGWRRPKPRRAARVRARQPRAAWTSRAPGPGAALRPGNAARSPANGARVRGASLRRPRTDCRRGRRRSNCPCAGTPGAGCLLPAGLPARRAAAAIRAGRYSGNRQGRSRPRRRP